MSSSPSPWRYALIVTAVGQLISPSLIFLLGSDALTSDSTETLITPPGWTFLMWGLICLLSLGYALYQRPRPTTPLSAAFDRLAQPLTAVFALYSLWLAAAELNTVWVTVVIFAAMLVGLLFAARIAFENPQLAQTRGPRLLVSWLLGTYTGWTSVAVFINLSAAIRQAGAPITSAVGLSWQSLLLLAAVAVAALITYRWKAPWPFVLTVIWALTGAATSTYLRDARPLSIECGVGIVIILIITYLTRRRGARSGAASLRGPRTVTT